MGGSEMKYLLSSLVGLLMLIGSFYLGTVYNTIYGKEAIARGWLIADKDKLNLMIDLDGCKVVGENNAVLGRTTNYLDEKSNTIISINKDVIVIQTNSSKEMQKKMGFIP